MLQPRRCGRMTACPRLLTGKSSVTPCTTAITIAWKMSGICALQGNLSWLHHEGGASGGRMATTDDGADGRTISGVTRRGFFRAAVGGAVVLPGLLSACTAAAPPASPGTA